MSSALLATASMLLYMAAGASYGAVLFLDAQGAPNSGAPSGSVRRATGLGRPLLLLGIAVQAAMIGVLCITTKRSPFASEYGTLVVASWATAIAYAILDFRAKLPALGAVSLLVACLMLFWALAHATGPIAETRALSERIVSVHVLATVSSLALFALAGSCAGLYILQSRQLKAHHSRNLFRKLPPLATLDGMAYHAVAWGLPLLTLGLALGIMYIYRTGMPTHSWWADPKTIVSFVVWLLYIAYLSARQFAGWRGVRLQYILLVGLIVAAALYAVPGPTHQFH